MSKRLILTGVAFIVLAGVGTGLWSARETRQEAPPVGPWLDSQGRSVPDGTNHKQGSPLVLHVFHGVEHCEWESATFLHLAWPLGTVASPPFTASKYRQYIRDPERALRPAVRLERYQTDVPPPGDAKPTGYHSDGWELWLSASEADRYVYLLHGKRAERWPRAKPPLICE